MKKAFVDEKYCVACGNCVNYCPKGIIAIDKGRKAVIDTDKCVGCGLCEKACPASVISIKEV